MINGAVGVSTPLKLQLEDGSNNKFPRAVIFNQANESVGSINLTHIRKGRYMGNFTFPAVGYYTVDYEVFEDNTYQVEDQYYSTESDMYYIKDPSAEQSSDANAISHAVWQRSLEGYAVANTAGKLLRDASIQVATITPDKLADAIWDEQFSEHTLPGTFGLMFDVIRQSAFGILNEVVSTDHGLSALKARIAEAQTALKNEIDSNEVKIDQIIPNIALKVNELRGEIDQNQLLIEDLAVQLVAATSLIVNEVNQNEGKIDILTGNVLSLSNNTTVRFIVPEQLIRDAVETKNYQFALRLSDDLGNPEAPDSTPKITIKDLTNGAVIINGAAMTQDGVKVGAYYYTYSVGPGTPTHPLFVEAEIVEGGVTRYVPATTEVTEFNSDLQQIQSQVGQLDAKVSDTQNKLNNSTYGLSALRSRIEASITEIDANEVLIAAVKAKTDTIPTNIAQKSDTQAVLDSLAQKPSLALIVDQLNLVKSAIMGTMNRSNTDVFNKIDFSPLLQSNDPRLTNLDAKISSRSTLTTQDVWTYVNRTLTGFTLPASEVKKIWDRLTSEMQVPNSIGQVIKDSLDAKISTRATSADLTNLTGIAKESTLNDVLLSLTSEANQNEIKLNTIINLLNIVKPKTDQIVPGASRETTVVEEGTSIRTMLASLNLVISGIKNKTDNLPTDPARETSVQQRPTNPVLQNDTRLMNLDVKISSRGTANASDLANMPSKSDLNSAKSEIIQKVGINEGKIDQVSNKINSVATKTDLSPLAKTQELAQSTQAIINAMPSGTGGGIGFSIADIWNYQNRTLTGPVSLANAQFTAIAKSSEVVSYTNKMSLVYRGEDQELILWAEKNGLRVVGENCTVTVKNSQGGTVWNASSSTANADGIFRFISPMQVAANSNYYVVISITVDGAARIAQQSFITVG